MKRVSVVFFAVLFLFSNFVYADGTYHEQSAEMFDIAIRTAFDTSMKLAKRGKKIVILNVDADKIEEAIFVLEELTVLAVNSPKRLSIIDRRMFDAFRAKNSTYMPSYHNDYILRYIGGEMGADYVMSAQIEGEGQTRRLNIKVLDVANGTLIGYASQNLYY